MQDQVRPGTVRPSGPSADETAAIGEPLGLDSISSADLDVSLAPAQTLSASVTPESGWRLGTVLAMPVILAIRAYQLVMSPMLVQSCRFYPSCSQYAVTALRRFGLFRGSWLAARRLLRCHPWNPGGVDHVPTRDQPRSCEHSVRGERHAA